MRRTCAFLALLGTVSTPLFAQRSLSSNEVRTILMDSTWRYHSVDLSPLKRFSAKSEYETTEAFRLRVQSFTDSLLGQSPMPLFVSIAKVQSHEERFRYDADRQELVVQPEVTCVMTFRTQGRSRTRNLIATGDSITTRDTYEATNAFGSTATVTRIRKDVVGIAADQPTGRCRSPFRVSITADRAQALRARLAYAVVYEPEGREVWTGVDSLGPTLGLPYDLATTAWAIPAKLRAYLLLDSADGSVVGWSLASR